MKVYLLWHIHHFNTDEDGNVQHFEEDGRPITYLDDEDDFKILGVYSSEGLARARIERARTLPGFKDEPDCFDVAEYDVDKDLWTSGYVTISTEHDQS
ncbi:DUF7336 domain-containing protein [Microtetraspora fusca]|uniref:DUF7336 domain-containing protein n=1 Tax=Microtetraspora fusca TaxID=1997 RepID=UPI0008329060|nr:hypothetical protein [Microtetraspora fusca]